VLRGGATLHLTGSVRGSLPKGMRVRIQVRTKHGHWRRLRQKRLNADGTFGASARLVRARLSNVRVGRRARPVFLRAVVPHVGQSNVVRVRLARR
jgi:hypothetical protein